MENLRADAKVGFVIDFKNYDVCSFDCYGTLIDWEAGIGSALRPILSAHGAVIEKDDLLETYARLESRLEAGPYLEYRGVLQQVVSELGRELGFRPAEGEMNALPESVRKWPPFPDTVVALRTLRRRYKLAVISNIDDELFEHTAELLDVPFDWVITAQQCGAYKPSPVVFRRALSTMGVSRDRVLHIAQSIYHDIVPARDAGLATVWVNRRHGLKGTGATPSAHGRPDLEVPDLKTLVGLMGL